MASNSVTPQQEAASSEQSREDRLFQALNSASMALFDIKGVCQLLINDSSIYDPGGPEEIAAVISMIHERAVAVHRAVGEVL